MQLLADNATNALGDWGAFANLSVLAAGIMLACVEVMWLRPRREERQQAAIERVQQLFLAECQAARSDHRQSITELRAEWQVQRQELLRLHERNCETNAQMSAAIRDLSSKFHA